MTQINEVAERIIYKIDHSQILTLDEQRLLVNQFAITESKDEVDDLAGWGYTSGLRFVYVQLTKRYFKFIWDESPFNDGCDYDIQEVRPVYCFHVIPTHVEKETHFVPLQQGRHADIMIVDEFGIFNEKE